MRKAFIVLITLGIIAMNVVLNLADAVDSREAVAITENQIYLEDVKLNRTEVNQAGYTVVKARYAYFDRNNNRVLLNDTELEYTDGANRFTSRADRGQYVFDERVLTRGHISGYWNDMIYQLGDNGTFEYDFTAGDGIFRDKTRWGYYEKSALEVTPGPQQDNSYGDFEDAKAYVDRIRASLPPMDDDYETQESNAND